MKGIDLSKFKKSSSDEKSTTLVHEDGHEFKIAHRALTPKMKSELSKLKENYSDKKIQRYAEGGPTGEMTQETVDPTPAPAQPPETLDVEPVNQRETAAVLAQEVPEDMAAPEPAQEQAAPSAAQPDTYQQDYNQAFNAYKQQHVQNFAREDAAFQQDLVNGHITPETYGSLFAKKDTLGKIGSIFGMLVGSAGAGLSHQPNAVLGMIQKQIDNDLAAQTQSKLNAQNFLRISQNGLLNQSQVALNDVSRQAQSFALAQARMMQSTYHNLVQNMMKLPEGPQKEAAKQMLGMMHSAMSQKINNINDLAAGASAYQNMLFGNQNGASTEEQKFQKQMNGMRMLGPQGESRAKDMEEKHIPGVGQASRPVPEQDRKQIEAMQVLSDKGKDLMNFARQNKGTMNPAKLAVGSQKAEEMLNFYNSSIQGGVLTQGRLEWLDKQIKKNPTSIFQDILGNNAQLQEIVNSNDTRRNTLLKNLGAPIPKEGPQAAGDIKKMDGVPYQKIGNSWHRVK